MATIKLFLGKSKAEKQNILVRIRDGRNIDIRWKSPYSILPIYWDDKKQTIKNRIAINPQEKAELLSNIEKIKILTEKAYNQLKETSFAPTTENFADYINALLYPKKYAKSTFFNDWEEFLLTKSNITPLAQKILKHCRDNLIRFEKFKQIFSNKHFSLSYDTLTDTILQEFYNFIIDEYKYIDTPAMKDFYDSLDKRQWHNIRHINTANTRIKKLKTFWLWAIKKGYTTKNPFYTFKIPADRYATPIFLLSDEVKKIYSLNLSNNKYLENIKDIFIFQCMVGCRREDLWQLTNDNFQNGFLVYIPQKTLETLQEPLKIPLNSIATEILDKYKDNDKPLPTYTSVDCYNRAITQICYKAELNRKVTVLNNKGLPEIKQLKDVVTSHTARKTFISILINNGVSSQVISSMTGHTPNSKAFARYFKIEDDIKTKVIKTLEI